MANQTQLLLIQDVEDLGRSGDIVKVRPGYARNFLLPQKKGIVPTKQTLHLQEKLRAERLAKAEEDRKESEKLAKEIEGRTLHLPVKVDSEGHLYGSVSALDLVRALEELGVHLEKRNILLPAPIKVLGMHEITLRLKEGVLAMFYLEILPEEF